jgi:hypothetical protein
MNQEDRIKAIDALEFLRCHPATHPEVLGDSMFDGMWFHMEKCCKHGKSEWCGKDGVAVYASDEGMYEKYKDKFDEEMKEYPETEKDLTSIHIPYEEFYGEPWVFDHVEYWYETTFWVFMGDPYSDKDYLDYKNWQRYQGPMGGANTFEEMIIDCAKQVKEKLGDFGLDDFYLPEEIENHKHHNLFLSSSAFDDEGYGLNLPLVRDEKYVDVNNGIRNLRWLEWFMGTDYYKENWNYEDPNGVWLKYLDKLHNVPSSRLDILKGENK